MSYHHPNYPFTLTPWKKEHLLVKRQMNYSVDSIFHIKKCKPMSRSSIEKQYYSLSYMAQGYHADTHKANMIAISTIDNVITRMMNGSNSP